MDSSESEGIPELYTLDTFVFSDESKGESIELKIQQVISSEYGLFIWPSSKVLAEYIWSIRESIKGKQILEVGAGTSLPGLVAAACGAHVVLTDREDAPHILENCRSIVHVNNPVYFIQRVDNAHSKQQEVFLDVTVVGFTWGRFSSKVVQLRPPDFILGADCFYDNTEVFEDLIASVAYFIKKKPSLRFLTAYQERSAQKTIKFLLQRWNLRAREIPLETFFPTEKYKLSNVVQLIEITTAEDA